MASLVLRAKRAADSLQAFWSAAALATGSVASPSVSASTAAAGAAAAGAGAADMKGEAEEDMFHSSDGSYDGCAATGMYG